ncbi:MAG: adenylyl-sulfate kinase [Rhodospirillaceae bacterium]|jgi:adenylyl-sulfate kinase|nr:adenylyl-sulfate kinase [Rhodospirillaceae bacterium]|tara:strand:- start:810 stop:1343 length:534 start_codon:yes stop_codon:yes gene_type:complete
MHAPGPVLWLMGPTSSGKTTLGEALVVRLRDKGTPAILFDGDEVRGLIGPGQGFSSEDRLQTVRALVHLANKVSDAGLVVVVAALTANEDARALVREQVNRLLVGSVQCAIETCAERDPKGLYAQAERAEIETLIGVNGEYTAPENPDIVLDTEAESVSALVDKLQNFLQKVCKEMV